VVKNFGLNIFFLKFVYWINKTNKNYRNMQVYKGSIVTVSELNTQLKNIIDNFPYYYVVGEISNFKKDVTGHWYFSLKDEQSQISCKMWRGVNNSVKFEPQNGMQVIVKGKLSIYVPYGNYSLIIYEMEKYGLGVLYEQFERLKAKLAAEGLFDKSRKRELPKHPKRIGIVTSKYSAALRDMIKVASKRYPIIELVVSNAKVQGEGAKESIAEAIDLLNKFENIDLIIVGRGGGSTEDLWAFNEEIVARAIAASKVPVISAVGHETDYTISDFVADMRAPTPSAAMEIALPDYRALLEEIKKKLKVISNQVKYLIEFRFGSHNYFINSHRFKIPEKVLLNNINIFEKNIRNLNYSLENIISKNFMKIKSLEISKLELNYQNRLNKFLKLFQNIINYDKNFENLQNETKQVVQQIYQKLVLEEEKLKFKVQSLKTIENNLNNNLESIINNYSKRIEILNQKIDKFNKDNILAMGYTIIRKDNKVVVSSKQLNLGDSVDVEFYDGNKEMTVK